MQHLFVGVNIQYQAAVTCSSVTARLGGVKMGSGMTGKLHRAWVGAWVVLLVVAMWGWDKCMCILPGLGEVWLVMISHHNTTPTTSSPSLPVIPDPILTPSNLGVTELYATAATLKPLH